MNDHRPRILGVLCNDFGELSFAMYLVQGQPFANCTLLLPPRLAAHNEGRLPVAARRFSSADDILRVVDEEQPDAVVLLSGYLLSIHGILRREELKELVERLRAKCLVLTSDPFAGLAFEGNLTDAFGFDLPSRSPLARLFELVAGRKLIRQVRTARRALGQVPHLYPFPSYCTGNRHDAAAPQRISFYNPELVRADGGRRGDVERSESPEWLFILGTQDWKLQQVIHHGQFATLVARKLEQTVDAGRTPILLGPEPILESLRPGLSRPDRVRLVPFLSYGSFEALMLSAEYVFYWNLVSASSVLRVVNDRPFFTFHEGHLVHNVKGLRERISAWYYQGWEPVVLDQTKLLDRDRLETLANDFRQASSRIRATMSRTPTPVEMIEALLTRHAP